MYQRALLVNRLSIPKPPAALEDRAQEHLGALGYDRTPVDHASGLMLDLDYARYIARTSTAPIDGIQLQIGSSWRPSSCGTAPARSSSCRGAR